MMARGGFTSLFPMHELSVMGLVEVLPSVLRLRRRLTETLDDIRAFRPHVLLTVDSKGFTFRVQRALASDPDLRDAVTRMHYVAPSVWAYRHRQRKTDFRDLQALLDKLFVILPFEVPLFNGGGSTETASDWCTFVGHPAVEDFLELHGVYDRKVWAGEAQATREDDEAFLEISAGGLLRGLALDAQALSQRGRLLETLTRQGRDDTDAAQQFRVERGLPPNAFVVYALVGRFVGCLISL
jgi:lipid A disaccharide synthetase